MHLPRPTTPRLEPIPKVAERAREAMENSFANAVNVIATIAHSRPISKAFGDFAQTILGVADVQVAVGLRWESGHHAAAPLVGLHIVRNDIADEVFGVSRSVCCHQVSESLTALHSSPATWTEPRGDISVLTTPTWPTRDLDDGWRVNADLLAATKSLTTKATNANVAADTPTISHRFTLKLGVGIGGAVIPPNRKNAPSTKLTAPAIPKNPNPGAWTST